MDILTLIKVAKTKDVGKTSGLYIGFSSGPNLLFCLNARTDVLSETDDTHWRRVRQDEKLPLILKEERVQIEFLRANS